MRNLSIGFVLVVTNLVTGFVAPCAAGPFVIDDFDGGASTRLVSRTISPATGSPSFDGSIFDVFGPTTRGVNFDFADDSAGTFSPDTFGAVPSAKTDTFFGVEDLTNPNNPSGGGVATWVFDISGLVDLSITSIFSAMGDFESGDNSHLFEASIDGGDFFTLFSIDGDNNDAFTYTMESGTQVALNDPLKLTDDLGTRIIDNSFTTVGSAAITGTGSTLTLRYTAGSNDGGREVFAFDDLILEGTAAQVSTVPEPASIALLGVGSLIVVGIRRRRIAQRTDT